MMATMFLKEGEVMRAKHCVKSVALVAALLVAWMAAGCSMMHHKSTTGAPKIAKVVRAEQFVLVGPDGQQQCVIKAGTDGPTIALMDAAGKERVQIGVVKMAHVPTLTSWGVTVLDADGHDRVAVGLADGAGGGGGVAVWDPKGVLRIGIGEGEPGIGIVLNDPDGKGRLGAGMAPNGWGSFFVHDPDGKTLWSTEQAAK
jgi:hypothetical protein